MLAPTDGLSPATEIRVNDEEAAYKKHWWFGHTYKVLRLGPICTLVIGEPVVYSVPWISIFLLEGMQCFCNAGLG